MANKGVAAFKAFTAGLLEKLPAEQRGKAEEYLNGLLALEPAAQALGDGIAGQSEIDRQLQVLRTQTDELETRKTELDERETKLGNWHANLTDWYAENKGLVEKAREGKKPNGAPAPTDPSKTGAPAGALTEDQFTERIGTERAAFLGFQRDQNLITREHFQKFGEIPELEPLLRHPQIAQLGLIGVYELVHKDRLDKWKADDEKKREDAIRLDERQKVQASMASLPYPTPTGAGSGSPLDALAVGKPDALVDQAAAHYTRLQTERLGAGGSGT